MQQYPDYFHIGIPRSGTTTIQHVLNKDPRINVCRSRYFQTVEWYLKEFDTGVNSSCINVHSDETMVRQGKGYFKFISTLARLQRTVPNAIIILTIREQKSWLLSRYKHGVGTGYVTDSFEDWLCSSQGIDFLSIGMYSDLYKAILGHFPKAQTHILLYEEMRWAFAHFLR